MDSFSNQHYKLILSLDTSSLNALFKKYFFTFGNLSLYTWFIIIISLSKETGERPGLEEKRNHIIIYRYHTKTLKPSADHNAATLTVALPKLWVHFSTLQILDLREDPGKQWQSAVSWRCWHPCPHTGSGRNPPIPFPVNANPNTEACKTPVHLLQIHLLFPSSCDCPLWQQEQPYSKRNHSDLWSLQCQKGAGQ